MSLYSRKSLSIMLILSMLLIFSAAYALALTEPEAESKFQSLGCTNCHKAGGPADEWDEVVDEIKAWATEYPDLDTAVKTELQSELNVNSFSELMDKMAQNAGVSSSDVSDLAEFFQDTFNEAKSAGGGGGTGGGFDTTMLLGIVAVIVIIVIVLVVFMRRK